MPDPGDAKPGAPPSNLASLRARLRNHARDVHQVQTRVQRRLAAAIRAVARVDVAARLGAAVFVAGAQPGPPDG